MELPKDFINYINETLENESDAFLASLSKEPSISIRLNPFKLHELDMDRVQWAEHAYYLNERPVFTMDPLFNIGGYYVQEASSMFMQQVFNQHVKLNDDMVVLDLCASPGGKSTHWASMLGGKGLLISNEVVSQRVAPLRENLTKWGYCNTVITNSKPEDFSKLNGFVDVLIVDAPCSGEGMFRKDEQSVKEWSLDNVKMCQERQQQILKSIFPVLKEGGLLIYSTCTYNHYEDEDNVKWICNELGASYLSVNVEKEWNITETSYGYHFYPYKTKGEGFFLSVMKKTKSENESKIKKIRSIPYCKYSFKDWILGDDYTFIEKNNYVYAYKKNFYDLITLLSSSLKVVQSGVQICQIKGKDYLPTTDLAMSNIFNINYFTSVALNWHDAMAFLKKESLNLPPDTSKGWVVLTFKGLPMGWVKNLGNRSNNAYPAEWHVRMAIDEKLYTEIIK